ncbi:hypothetical protein SSX86_030466 [Deinandra increscens subsp. villosa]|uniref:Uncharacterized protein n=1 Tax=Deinandra increscens subsp. villosa TaxID=3103831 RepID=A0AAP0GJN4_9ASTR
MHPQAKIEDSGFSPSFNCYSSETSTSRSVAKVILEEQAARSHEIDEFEDEGFEFSLLLSEEDDSVKQIDSRVWTAFPLFNRDLLETDEVVDREIKLTDDENEIDASFSVTSPLAKLFIDDPDESSSDSSSEVDELEKLPSGTFCVWRPNSPADGGSSPAMSKCKKSSSTGSGSKRWRIRYLLRRSNSEGKEPVVLLTRKKSDSPNPKQKRNSGEVPKVAGRWKAQTPVHEQFYVKRRAENEIGKRKSYLPYRKDLVGLFANVNGMGKMLPF